jgi:hypothetical protein
MSVFEILYMTMLKAEIEKIFNSKDKMCSVGPCERR